tara:strand:- start:225 stop:359 length:135 start_codon:yes stop_codon:yes gene_type:complete
MYSGDCIPLMLAEVEDEEPPKQPLKTKKDKMTGIIRNFFISKEY